MAEAEVPQPHRVDDATRERLVSLKAAINQYADLLCDNSIPRQGSEFREEEGKLSIRSPRDVATVVALNALDHLRLLADHALATSRITAFASFTLVRSAITAAGLAGWLLAAKDSKERLRRTLVITYHELSNARTAARELSGETREDRPENEGFNLRLQAIQQVIERYSFKIEQVKQDVIKLGMASDFTESSLKNNILRKPSDTSLVGEAAELISTELEYYHDFGSKKEAVRVWRTMSAHAHGLSWAAELTAITTLNGEGAFITTWNPQGEDLLQGIQVAWDLLYGACARYIELLGAQT